MPSEVLVVHTQVVFVDGVPRLELGIEYDGFNPRFQTSDDETVCVLNLVFDWVWDLWSEVPGNVALLRRHGGPRAIPLQIKMQPRELELTEKLRKRIERLTGNPPAGLELVTA